MSNQQGLVSRPWFRLASMMRPPPPPPTTPAPPSQPPEPLPPPRTAFIRPTFRAPPPPPPQEPTPPPPPPAFVASPPPPPPPSPPTVVPQPPPAPPSPQIVAPTPPTTLVPPGPTMPSPRNIGTPPPTASAAEPPPPSAQLLASSSSSIPSSPITKRPFPSFPSPKPNLSIPSPSPPQSPSPSKSGTTTTTPPPTAPISSPKTVKPLEKTPPPSPNLRAFSRPPSPLTLPPPQISSDTEQNTRSPPVFEQKSVLVQETNQKPNASPKNFNMLKPIVNTNSPKHDSPKQNKNHKKHLDSEGSGTMIITIAGENKGAIMELSQSRKTTELGHIIGQKSGSNNSNDTTKNKNQKAIPRPMTAFTNSNVQCVNNSILYNCSVTHHDPGVHFSVSRKPNGHLKD